MKTIQIQLIELDELEEKARERALREYAYFNVEDDWWRDIYEDGKMVKLKLTGFDLDRGAYCNGEWIADARTTASLILENHGEKTDTYLTAKAFAGQKVSDEEEWADSFLSAILKDYLAMLQYEYDYLTSDKAVVETIEANEYLFTADGLKANRIEKLAIDKINTH
ncbi:hypothetical protein ACFQZS_03910 [Mucilaginibacter calamicampi]|uniref:Phage protein n=1 Tax=Mucilaginibacter calamicampi TaxID=1302352 RepID=A0ABW2YS93_9SPHI